MTAAATVYLATNTVNGKRYVGITKRSVRQRFTTHVYIAMRRPRTYFHHAIAKHGAENFTVEEVASCLSADTAFNVERTVIQQLKPEYNQTNGGEFTVGKRVPRDVVEKIRQGSLGKKRTPEMKAANSAQAKARYDSDPVYRAKVLAAMAKALATCDRDKQRAATSKASKARVWSDESRAKLSASCMGRRYGQDVIARASAKKNKAVVCVETGVVYASVSDAASATGLSISGVSCVARGKRNSANGLRFHFVDTQNGD